MTIPDSYFFTFSTSFACLSIEKFLWITPMPPNCAIAMASLCSVTVSIAEEISGILRWILFVSCVFTSASPGPIELSEGCNKTSSKVNASSIIKINKIF